MTQIAQCESGFGTNPRAYDGSSVHQGAFQFLHSTWLGTPPGQEGYSAYDDWQAARGAAWMLSQGRRGEWPNC